MTVQVVGIGTVSVPHGADIFGQLEAKHSCAWSVCLDILGSEAVHGPGSRVMAC
jgi:hypothetical protein